VPFGWAAIVCTPPLGATTPLAAALEAAELMLLETVDVAALLLELELELPHPASARAATVTPAATDESFGMGASLSAVRRRRSQPPGRRRL
jgi:hypothetical protein